MNEHKYICCDFSVMFMEIYRLCGVPGVTAVARDGVGDTSILSSSSIADLAPDCSSTSSTAEGERFDGGVPALHRLLGHASRVRIRSPLFCT